MSTTAQQSELLPPSKSRTPAPRPVCGAPNPVTGAQCQGEPGHDTAEHDDGLTTWMSKPPAVHEAAVEASRLREDLHVAETQLVRARAALAHVGGKLEEVRRELRDMDTKRLPQRAQARMVHMQEVLFGAWQVAQRGYVVDDVEDEEGKDDAPTGPAHEDDEEPEPGRCTSVHHGHQCELKAGHESAHHAPAGAIKNGWTGWWPRDARADAAEDDTRNMAPPSAPRVDSRIQAGPDAAERKWAEGGGDAVDRREREVMAREALVVKLDIAAMREEFDAAHPTLTPGEWVVGALETYSNGAASLAVEEPGGAVVALLEADEVNNRANLQTDARVLAAAKDLAAVLAAQTALLERIFKLGALGTEDENARLVAAARHLLKNALTPAEAA